MLVFLFCAFIMLFIITYFTVILLQLSQFLPLCPPLPSPSSAPPVIPHPVVHVHRSVLTCSLTSPFPFFPPLSPSPSPSGPCQSVPCFHASGSILLLGLFCSPSSSYMLPHMSLRLCSFFFDLFSLLFRMDSFCRSVFKLTDRFCQPESALESPQ